MEFLRWSAYKLSEAPKSYGWLHLFFVVVMIAVTILMICKIKKVDNNKLDKIILGFGIMLLVIETYKQLVYTLVLSDDGSYQWYAFPFQFCSSPMYVCLIVPLVKNVKVKEALYGYLAFFGTIAGIAVMAYPGDILVDVLSISLHSLIWHSSMVVLGIFIITKRNYGVKIKEVIPSLFVFYAFVVIAQILNITFYHGFIKDLGDTFNMFFISPYFESTLPVFSIFYQEFGWIVCFILYLIGFSLGSIVVHLIVRGLKKIFDKNESAYELVKE